MRKLHNYMYLCIALLMAMLQLDIYFVPFIIIILLLFRINSSKVLYGYLKKSLGL